MTDPMQNDFADWVGRTDTSPPDIITPRLQASFDATLGAASAKLTGAPAGVHWCLAPPIESPEKLGPDGHPEKGGFLPPVPLPRRMWAGGHIEFIAPLAVGDEVFKTSSIKSVQWKTGKTGRMCFVIVSHEYATTRGLAIREDHNIVYRAAAEGPSQLPPPNACDTVFERQTTVDVDAVQLFRYSALTFNGHRIHYDVPYVRDVEFYPDLVIHGPLQATLLLNFAAKQRGALPKTFSYRGLSPATGAQQLTLGANNQDDGSCTGSVIAQNGVETMRSTATW